MKKKLIGLAVFGVVLATVGGSGAVIYYQKADKQLKQTVAETYQAKDRKNNTQLELALKGDVHYTIEQSSDEQFHLNTETYSPSKQPPLTWETNDQSGKTLIDVTFNKTEQVEPVMSFNIWDNHYEYVTLSIPKSYQTIAITTANADDVHLSVEGLAATDLALTTHDGSADLNELRLTTLTATSDSGSLLLDSVIVEKESQITSKDGEITINDVRSEALIVKNQDERIYLDTFIGTSQIETEYGDIYLTNLKGKNETTSIDGNIYWQQEKITDDSDLRSNNGNIVVDLIDKIKQLEVTAKSKHGEILLLNKEKKTYQTGTNGPTLLMSTTYGDITLSDDGSYSDEFDYYD